MNCPECDAWWDSEAAASECATIDAVEARNARSARRRSAQRSALAESDDD